MEENKDITKEIDYKDLYIRLLADYQNLQRNSSKEKLAIKDEVRYNTLKGVLSLYHDLKQGLSYNEEGIKIVYNKFVNFLNTNGIGIINKDFFVEFTDNKFDESYAEAISVVESNDPKQDKIIANIIEDGFYDMNTGKIISYAKVIVYINKNNAE